MKSESIRIEVTSKEVKKEDGKDRIGYGIIAYRTEPSEIVFRIDDISSDEEDIIRLARLITDDNVSIDDFREMLEKIGA